MKKFILALLLMFTVVVPQVVFADGEFASKPYQAIWNFPEQFQSKLDYGARTDDQAVYIGRAPKGTTTSQNNWVIFYLTYDGSNRLESVTVSTGAWLDRASLTYE